MEAIEASDGQIRQMLAHASLQSMNLVEVLVKENQALIHALEAVEWITTAQGTTSFCPRCLKKQAFGHTGDCIVGNALASARGETS